MYILHPTNSISPERSRDECSVVGGNSKTSAAEQKTGPWKCILISDIKQDNIKIRVQLCVCLILLEQGVFLGLARYFLYPFDVITMALSSSFAFFSEVLSGASNTLMINSNQTQILQMKIITETFNFFQSKRKQFCTLPFRVFVVGVCVVAEEEEIEESRISRYINYIIRLICLKF